MTEQQKLNSLVLDTTIKWVESSTALVVAGNKNENEIDFFERNQYMRNQRKPISFSTELEPICQKAFKAFGVHWDDKRQKYRFLYDAMRSFFISFIGLQEHKLNSIGTKKNSERVFQGDLATSHLRNMYFSGKKALDLAIKLNFVDRVEFVNKFIGTRNLFFEHNWNPRKFKDWYFEPSFGNIIATKSILPIYIHTTTNIERKYEAFVDYYQDYYDLEEILCDVVKIKFN